MKPSVFITGATGFLGREFLKRLDPTQFNSIFCLVRDPNTKLLATLPENIVKVVGDLDDPSSYQACLNEVQYVVHMAAVTGKVSPKKYHQNIVEGTRALVQLCVEAKVERFIYISSIAAKFEKLNRYYYGIAKKAAEEIVTNSGLNYLILRPTMIMGAGSPVFEGLFKLALAPIIPVFGNGKIQVQPIDVTDAAALVSSYLMRKDIANHVIELGGPEVMTIDGFLIQIKRGYLKDSHAKTRVFHIPMALTLAGLTPLELLFYRFLPITVGQMASFRNDSTVAAEKNLPSDGQFDSKIGVDQMIRNSIPDNQPADTKKLERECYVFSKYLSGMKPTPYVIEKYLDYHALSKDQMKKNWAPFDSFILGFASKAPVFTKLMDIYTKFFKPKSILRFKLTYLLAILEVSSPFYDKIEVAPGMGRLKFLVLLGFKGGLFALQLLLGALLFLPFDLLSRLFKSRPKELKNV